MMKTFVRPLLAAALASTLAFGPALLTYAQDAPAAQQTQAAPSTSTIPTGVGFIYLVQSEHPFLVNTDFPAIITSTLSLP